VFGPITARAEYALGEQAGSASNGSAVAVGVADDNGPLILAGAYTKRKINVLATGAGVAAGAAGSAFQDNKDYTLGASYKFSGFRVAGGWADEKQSTTGADVRQKNAWFGGVYDLTPAMALTAAYYDTRFDNINGLGASGKRQLFIIGGTYALSKSGNCHEPHDK